MLPPIIGGNVTVSVVTCSLLLKRDVAVKVAMQLSITGNVATEVCQGGGATV